MTDDDNIHGVYEDLMKTVVLMIDKYDPMAIAGCMIVQALSIYRSTMSEEDYNSIIDKIVDSKDRVKVFNDQGNLH